MAAPDLCRGGVCLRVAGLMAASGGPARSSGGDRLRAALAGGDGGASQRAVPDLVNAILQLGYLPIQSSRSSAEEKRLARIPQDF